MKRALSIFVVAARPRLGDIPYKRLQLRPLEPHRFDGRRSNGIGRES